MHVRLKDNDTARLRAAINATGLTQAEVARRASFSYVRLSHLARGKSWKLEYAPAARLEEALGLDPGTLFELDDLSERDVELISAYLPRPTGNGSARSGDPDKAFARGA